MGWRLRWFVLLGLGSVAAAACGAELEAARRESEGSKAVFHDGRKQPLEYVGPGREQPEPTNVEEVRIGYFGPDDPNHAEFGTLWSAAQIAIDQANHQGGYRGKPFRLVARWSDNPWTGGAAQATRMVYGDGVWAIVGGMDGATTHLAEQIAAKARLAIVSPVSTDRSAHSAFVPWMFSCLPGDDTLAPLLVERLAAIGAQDAFVILAVDDHDARLFLNQLTTALRKQNVAPRRRFVFAGTKDPSPLVQETVREIPRAVVVVAPAESSARVTIQLREAGYRGPILGGPWMGRRPFVETVAKVAGDVVFPLLYAPSEPLSPFAAEFDRRVGKPPDYAAAATHDAIMLVAAAVRAAGLNRAKIADAIRALAPWEGECGAIHWDALGGNLRPVPLGTIRDGTVARLP